MEKASKLFFSSSLRTFLLLTVSVQLSNEKKISKKKNSALCTRSVLRPFVAIREKYP